jgi:hypothetical protein
MERGTVLARTRRGRLADRQLGICAAMQRHATGASALSHTGHQSYMHMHLRSLLACSMCVLASTDDELKLSGKITYLEADACEIRGRICSYVNC